MTKKTVVILMLAGCGAGAILSMVVESIERAYIETDRSRTIREHIRYKKSLKDQGRIGELLSYLKEVDDIVENTEQNDAA